MINKVTLTFAVVVGVVASSPHALAQSDEMSGEEYYATTDRNGDGRITHEEFQRSVESQLPHLSRDQVEAFADDLMAMMDSDGDGEVTEVEYALALHRRKGGKSKACVNCD